MIEFFTTKNIQTIIDGGLTFGIYHSIVTQRQLEEFNKKMDLERKILYEKHNIVYKEDIKMLYERLEKLEDKF
jgi:hypothetical protein